MEKQKLQLRTRINAPKEKVWNVLLQDETYRQWTAPFCEGSYAVGDWSLGSKVHFLSPDGGGLVSKVVEHQPNERITFEHQGFVKDGKEDFESEAVKGWQGSLESYQLKTVDGGTELAIEQDMETEHAEKFTTMWHQALQKVKELSERAVTSK